VLHRPLSRAAAAAAAIGGGGGGGGTYDVTSCFRHECV